MKFVRMLFLSALVLMVAGNVWGLNYDPLTPAPAPVLGLGWTYDQIDAAFADSNDSPYIYNLAEPVVFRITDQFVAADTYYVYDNLALILTTAVNGAQPSIAPIGDPAGDLGWTSVSYSHGQITLGAGPHSLTVQGDGLGGLTAGFYTRIDNAVPEPMTMILLGAGLLGLVGFARRKS